MKESGFIKGLNKEQIEVVLTTEGPVQVLAGAGSGKTRTLVHRLAYLVAEKKVSPDHILAVTFTNKAAQEMKQRVKELVGKDCVFGALGTFHAVSCRFLRAEAKHLGYPPHFSIYDEDDQKSLLKEAMREVGLSTKKIQPGAIGSAISRAKADLLSPSEYGAEVADDYFTENVAKVYERYQSLLLANRAFDFDDLIGQMVRLWQQQPEVLKRYQKKYQYILIDEYQDVNRAQYEWTKLLAEGYQNLCVVGDDWQSIYGWRGADFGNILRFKQDYPEAQVIKLEQNYRSTQMIVTAGNAVMQRAQLKADKKLWTKNSVGEPIKIINVENEVAEARFVTDEIIKLTGGTSVSRHTKQFLPEIETLVEYEDKIGLPSILPEYMTVKKFSGQREALREYAVLYRTNAQSRAMEEACLRAGLPYQLVGGLRFYERREVKDVLAWLRMILNPADGVSFERAILSVPRGVGLTTVEKVLALAKTNKIDVLSAASSGELNLKEARAQGLVQFINLVQGLVQKLPSISVAELIDIVADQGGLRVSLDDGTSGGTARLENIEELKTVAEARAPGKGKEALEKFLTDVALWQDRDKLDDKKGGVTLMTVHAAKGLEYNTVFIIGMEEGLFPHASSFAETKELEEERRLVYVAITRAREQVYCVWAEERRIFGKLGVCVPSRFLAELPEELVESVNVLNFEK